MEQRLATGCTQKTYDEIYLIMKFKTKTYHEAVEMAAKMMTVDNDSTAEMAMISFIYGQHPLKVMKDVESFYKRWSKLVTKDEQ